MYTMNFLLAGAYSSALNSLKMSIFSFVKMTQSNHLPKSI